MSPTNHKLRGFLSTIVTLLVLVAIASLIVLNRQTIIDYINYFEYKPTSQMASFANRSSMNNEGKFLFYSAKPSLQDKTAFNQSCPSTSSDVAILGCYDGEKIYIYNVTDSRLDGIRDVTAAYEMLHAAYKRLSPSDHKKVDALIEVEFANKGDDAMRQIVSYFATSEPGQRDNELFSLIATQVPVVSPQLEAIYARYFTNRQTLVSLYNKYSSVFSSNMAQAAALSSQLTDMNESIKTATNQYNSDASTLNQDIDTFNTRAQSNNFSSQSEFESQKTSLTNRENALKSEQAKINAEIVQYNTLLDQYNALNTSSKQLFNSINSLSSTAK